MNLYKYTFESVYDWTNSFSHVELKLLRYPVLRETNYGYWILYYGNKNKKKWVPKNGKNLFAFSDKNKALENFYYRKKRQIRLISFNLNRIMEAAELAKKQLNL